MFRPVWKPKLKLKIFFASRSWFDLHRCSRRWPVPPALQRWSQIGSEAVSQPDQAESLWLRARVQPARQQVNVQLAQSLEARDSTVVAFALLNQPSWVRISVLPKSAAVTLADARTQKILYVDKACLGISWLRKTIGGSTAMFVGPTAH